LEWSKPNIYFEPDKGFFYIDAKYTFLSLPDSKIRLSGSFSLRDSEEISRFLLSQNIEHFKEGLFLESTLGENERVLYAFNKLYSKDPKKFSSMNIFWNKKDLQDPDFLEVFRSHVSMRSDSWENRIFEKGLWQEYLSQIYLTSLLWGDTENKKNLLE